MWDGMSHLGVILRVGSSGTPRDFYEGAYRVVFRDPYQHTTGFQLP